MYTGMYIVAFVSATFLLVFFKSKREHLQRKEKCILLLFKSSLSSSVNQILTFQIFKFHEIIKYLSMNKSMKQETNFTGNVGSKQFSNEICQVYVI